MLLASEVLECGIDPRRCNMDTLQKSGVSADVLDALRALSNAYVELRQERNFRFHHGFERSFSDDDSTFRTASLFEHRGRGIVGEDQHGRQIDVDRYFKDGLKGLRADFTAAARSLYVQINALYDLLYDEFEPRFSKKFRARTRQLPW